MAKNIILFNLFTVLIITRIKKSSEECLCNVIVRGEYCGTELNRRNGNSDCQPNHMYFCSDTIDGKPPKFLAECKNVFECEQNQFSLTRRTRRRNPCLSRMKCRCPTGLGRGPHCGSKLIGDDCPTDMLFICRSRNRIDSRDVCLDGCNNGKCILAVDDDNRQREPPDTDSDQRSDDESDKET